LTGAPVLLGELYEKNVRYEKEGGKEESLFGYEFSPAKRKCL